MAPRTHAGSGVGIQDRIQTEGIRTAGETFLAIGGRLHNVQGGAPLIYRVLEAEYKRKFDAWKGKGNRGPDYMVETGDTRTAWTARLDHGTLGAIREAHNDSILFGSSIFYNKFHWRALTRHSPRADDLIAEVMADYFMPEDKVAARGYYQTRGNKRVFIRSYIRGKGSRTPDDA